MCRASIYEFGGEGEEYSVQKTNQKGGFKWLFISTDMEKEMAA